MGSILLKKGVILFLIVSILLFSSVFAVSDSVLIKYYDFPHVTKQYQCWFEIPNVILVYDYNSLSDFELNQCLVHEMVHYYAWNLWKVHPQDHERFFTGKGNYLID